MRGVDLGGIGGNSCPVYRDPLAILSVVLFRVLMEMATISNWCLVRL